MSFYFITKFLFRSNNFTSDFIFITAQLKERNEFVEKSNLQKSEFDLQKSRLLHSVIIATDREFLDPRHGANHACRRVRPHKKKEKTDKFNLINGYDVDRNFFR